MNAVHPAYAVTTSIHQLLDTAGRLLDDTPAGLKVGRYRGASFALRAALEMAVANALRSASLASEHVSLRGQFLCLRSCTEAATARRAKAVWALLCLGCHYHQYELGPTADQVRVWHAEVTDVVVLLGI
ncbi:hypothetical protein ACFWNT_06000 [Streptomyces sp. NPDC058409]|uniref:hypothetical protein n=1 Tax=Streptomyces sp. NPDC058409 TaxID=3346484 RepID=UPI00364AE8C8